MQKAPFAWQPHPSPNITLSFYRVELGDQGKPSGKPRWRLMILTLMKARILPERSLVFQFSDFLFSGSFKCDKRRYFILNKKVQDCLALVTKH